jgi:Na+/phosphate symporter
VGPAHGPQRILRAFGPDLRSLLAKGLSNRFTAFAAGLGLTALLQSSTAPP